MLLLDTSVQRLLVLRLSSFATSSLFRVCTFDCCFHAQRVYSFHLRGYSFFLLSLYPPCNGLNGIFACLPYSFVLSSSFIVEGLLPTYMPQPRFAINHFMHTLRLVVSSSLLLLCNYYCVVIVTIRAKKSDDQYYVCTHTFTHTF